MKRITYNTMNSWNNSTAPAYNMKVYNIIPKDLQNKVFELMESEDFYDVINDLIHEFNMENNYQFQAGFNGRSGGYLVLYKGGIDRKTYKEEDFKANNGYNGRVYINDRHGWKNLEEAKKLGLINKPITMKVYTRPGQSIDIKEVPSAVLKSFRRLAEDIRNHAIYSAKHCNIIEEEILIPKKIKRIA